MGGRAWRVCFFCCMPSVLVGGCHPSSVPPGGSLSAGPYPESRSIIEWIRIQTDDPEANVLRWGLREEKKKAGGSKQEVSIVIEVHYQATIGNVNEGHWKQTICVTGRQIQEETPRVPE